ncbi:MAG: tetratricopeptide repeat protein [Vampirovibrionales bacterium]|nr:tetratricopeptide repeat protein [Vampirovibrionales bacterium]
MAAESSVMDFFGRFFHALFVAKPSYKTHTYCALAAMQQTFVLLVLLVVLFVGGLTPLQATGAPVDPQTSFNQGLALVKLRKLPEARNAFEEAIHNSPPGSALAQKARHNLSIVSQAQIAQQSGNTKKALQIQQMSKASGGDYLSAAIDNGRVIHWDLRRMPLRYYVESGKAIPGWQPAYAELVGKAAISWQNASYNKLRFVRVYNKAQADIVISWAKRLTHNRLGVSPFQSMGDVITQSDVVVGLESPADGHRLPPNELLMTIMHELGHALGIHGHSPYPSDVMYFSSHPSQTLALSNRDKATIRLLYKLDADVSNDITGSTTTNKGYYENLSKTYDALKKGQPGNAVAQAQETIRKNPNNPKGYIYLGIAYQNLNNHAQAATAYRNALNLDPADTQANTGYGVVLINLGVQAAQKQQYTEAKGMFTDATNRLQYAASKPDATPDARAALEIARKNLALFNQ